MLWHKLHSAICEHKKVNSLQQNLLHHHKPSLQKSDTVITRATGPNTQILVVTAQLMHLSDE